MIKEQVGKYLNDVVSEIKESIEKHKASIHDLGEKVNGLSESINLLEGQIEDRYLEKERLEYLLVYTEFLESDIMSIGVQKEDLKSSLRPSVVNKILTNLVKEDDWEEATGAADFLEVRSSEPFGFDLIEEGGIDPEDVKVGVEFLEPVNKEKKIKKLQDTLMDYCSWNRNIILLQKYLEDCIKEVDGTSLNDIEIMPLYHKAVESNRPEVCLLLQKFDIKKELPEIVPGTAYTKNYKCNEEFLIVKPHLEYAKQFKERGGVLNDSIDYYLVNTTGTNLYLDLSDEVTYRGSSVQRDSFISVVGVPIPEDVANILSSRDFKHFVEKGSLVALSKEELDKYLELKAEFDELYKDLEGEI